MLELKTMNETTTTIEEANVIPELPGHFRLFIREEITLDVNQLKSHWTGKFGPGEWTGVDLGIVHYDRTW